MFNLFKKKPTVATPPGSPDAKGAAAASSANRTRIDSPQHNSNSNSHSNSSNSTGTPVRARAVTDMEWERQLIRAVDENRIDDVHELSLGAPSAKLTAAMAMACEKGKIMSMSVLLESGANIDHPMTPPLYYATVGGSIDAVRLLISRGAPAHNAHDAVRKAIESLRKDILKELVNAGAPLGPAPHGARSALHWAALRGNTCAGILRFLLALPAATSHLNAIDTERGATPLLLAVRSDKASHNAVRELVHAGANVDQTDRFSLSPLYWAAVNRKTEAIELLLAAGADPNPPVLPLLPSIAAHVQLDKRRMDAVDDALFEIVTALIVAGVTVRAKDADEITAATRISSLVSTVVEDNDAPLPASVQRVFSVLLASGAVDTDFVDETVSGGNLLDRLNIDAADFAVEGKSLVARKRTSLYRERALEVCFALRRLNLPTRVVQSVLQQVCRNTERYASDKLKLQLVVLVKTMPLAELDEAGEFIVTVAPVDEKKQVEKEEDGEKDKENDDDNNKNNEKEDDNDEEDEDEDVDDKKENNKQDESDENEEDDDDDSSTELD